jgi:hypothetical protein
VTRAATVTIQCEGHAQITATHAKTFELTIDDDIGPRATCVIGVGADEKRAGLGALSGPVEITLNAGGHRQVVHAYANPFLDPVDGLIVRRSDFRDRDTLAINADAGAADLDRALVHALADLGAHLDVRIRPVGNPPAVVAVTDRADHGWRAPGLTVHVVRGPLDRLPPLEGDEIVATRGIPVVAALLTLLGSPTDVIVLGERPRGVTARRTHLAAARSQAGAVVWVGPARDAVDLLDQPDAVVAVDRGEVVTRVGPVAALDPAARIPADATLTVALLGTASSDGRTDRAENEELLGALLAEGVSARTLRQALARVPRLAGQWDYDALRRLQP